MDTLEELADNVTFTPGKDHMMWALVMKDGQVIYQEEFMPTIQYKNLSLEERIEAEDRVLEALFLQLHG